MKRLCALAVIILVAAGCNGGSAVRAKVARDVRYMSHTYDASANECYYALRWAFKINGYTLSKENLVDGILTSTWRPVTSDSHYLDVFNRRDYGASGGYYQLEVKVIPHGRETLVKVGTRVKSITTLESSGVEERKVFAQVGNYLRSKEPDLSNEGIDE